METWLKAKTAGLPRWAWVAGLSGAVVLGLYLRSRSKGESESSEENEGYYGGEYESAGEGGGIGGGGVIGGGGGSTTTPVNTPYIPEGFTEMFGQLTELVGKQNEQIGVAISQEAELAKTISEMHGGSPPEPGYHEAPAPAPGPTSEPGGGGGGGTNKKPQCPQNIKNKIESNKNEISRLQGEIQRLRSEAQSMNNTEKRGGETKSGKQSNAQGKQAKVQSLSDENNRLRQTPGCS